MNTTQPTYRLTGILLLLQGLLIFAPLFILGAAINWPASLSEPASVVLPQLITQAAPVQLGYTIYLVYSILFLAVGVLTAYAANGAGSLRPVLFTAAGLSIASSALRVIGIIRWLFAMPYLARAYTAPGVTAETQTAITLIYDVLNAFAGQIGEFLGVSLFAGLWMLLISIAILQHRQLPTWLGIFGLVAAAAQFIPLVELIGIDLGAFISVTVAVLHFWFLAAGVRFLLPRPLAHQSAPATA